MSSDGPLVKGYTHLRIPPMEPGPSDGDLKSAMALFVNLTLLGGRHLPKMSDYRFGDLAKTALGINKGWINSFVSITLTGGDGKQHQFRTSVVPHNYNPNWNYTWACTAAPGPASSIQCLLELFDQGEEGPPKRCGFGSYLICSKTPVQQLIRIPLQLEAPLRPSDKATHASLHLMLNNFFIQSPDSEGIPSSFPESMVESTENLRPRFNGLYATLTQMSGSVLVLGAAIPVGESISFLRFYPDHSVISATVSMLDFLPGKLLSWFFLNSPKKDHIPSGKWFQSGNRVHFFLSSARGDVLFDGTNNDGSQLAVEFQSKINGFRSSKRYFFLDPSEYDYPELE